MEFRNALYMSVLLVVEFVCLHFYEESVVDEFNVHNWMLKEVVDDHEMSVEMLLGQSNSRYSITDEDILKFYSWRSEVKDLESLVANPSLKNLITSKQLFTKYDVDEDYLIRNGHISNLAQFHILDGIINQSTPVFEELLYKDKIKRQKDIHVIISQRQNKYAKNEEYELELEVVELFNDKARSEFFIEINGKKDTIHSIPYFLPKNTKTGVIIGNIKNPVTGERKAINKNVFP